MNNKCNLDNLLKIADLSQAQLAKSDARQEALVLVDRFLAELEHGSLRSANRDTDGVWTANSDVKKAILLCFKIGNLAQVEAGTFSFVDKDTFPTQQFSKDQMIRIVPGGSSVRRGAFLGKSVTMMPPAYVNVGAYVDEGTMIDSHALVGSCAQIGKRVHLSAAAQVGGVLEPIGATPVVVEDDAFIGGNCGLYEGTIIREKAVVAAGVVLTRSSIIYDLVNDTVIRCENDSPLEIPRGAVVVPATRPARGEFAKAQGINLACCAIVKYRDDKTDGKAMLESALR